MGAARLETLAQIAPFVATGLIAAISPLMSNLIRQVVCGRLSEARRLSVSSEHRVPVYQRIDFIGDYVAYAADAAQVTSGVFATIIGAILVLGSDLTGTTIALIMALTIPSALGLLIWVLQTDPSRYVART